MKYVEKTGNHYKPTKQGKLISLAPQNVYNLAKNPVKFWEDMSKEIDWIKPWKTSYKKEKSGFSWFKEGKLNLCYNAVDRHLKKPDKTAIIFIPENPKEKKQIISYKKLFEMVNQAASLLVKNKIKKGDVIAIYMPLIPEAFAFMLACARIGAIHSVVFSAYSADALKTRIKDGNAKLLITADYYFRKGEKVDLKNKANLACKGIKIKKIILKRKKTGKILNAKKIPFIEPEPMNAEDIAFILYTSGTTGAPKGVMHAVGGYTVQAYTSSKYIFNLKEDEVLWCTSDIGWITGHSYTCYGPLLNNATTILYEGLPNYPDKSRYLKIIKENKVNVFYTAPTALRLFALGGTGYTKKYKLDSLKILGSVGEPIDEKTWRWYFDNIGKKRCPIIDTYWQTETGSAVVCSLPGIGPFIPKYAGKPFPGMEYQVINEKGKRVKAGKKGLLVQSPPFCPALIRGVWKNNKRYKKYFGHGYYLAGDNAFKDSKGYIRILGRSDDLIKVAGHRMSTAEIENAIATLPEVTEVAIVAKPDELRGEVPIAFVKTKKPISEEAVIKQVTNKIGPIAKPKEVYFVKDIPKTRSGKMVRRLLKNLLINEPIKNTSTMVNPKSLEEIKVLLDSKGKDKK